MQAAEYQREPYTRTWVPSVALSASATRLTEQLYTPTLPEDRSIKNPQRNKYKRQNPKTAGKAQERHRTSEPSSALSMEEPSGGGVGCCSVQGKSPVFRALWTARSVRATPGGKEALWGRGCARGRPSPGPCLSHSWQRGGLKGAPIVGLMGQAETQVTVLQAMNGGLIGDNLW